AERLLNEVRLFVRRLDEGLGPRRRPAPALHPADVRLAGKKVLLADDDMRTVYALSATLRAKGMEVLVADTGKAALDLLAQRADVDAVLMDIMMPEMDGYEAMRRIRQDARFADLPVIALTAKAMKGEDRKSTRLNSSHLVISYAVFCLIKKKIGSRIPGVRLARRIQQVRDPAVDPHGAEVVAPDLQLVAPGVGVVLVGCSPDA